MAKVARKSGTSGWVVSSLLVGVIVMTGCDGRSTAVNPPSKEPVARVSLVSATATDDDPGRPGRPEDNAAETQKYLESLTWADSVPYAAATFDITSASETARVKVVPVAGAHEVSWQSALGEGVPGGNGHFVATIYNLENKKIPRLGMQATDPVGYLWIGERPNARRGAAVYVFPVKGSVTRRKNLPVVGFCPGQHPGPKARSTEAADCTGPFQPTNSVQLTMAVNRPAFADQGLWLSCRGGCCEVQLTE